MEYLKPTLSKTHVNSLNNLVIAHIGDAVYELMVRTYYGAETSISVSDQHRKTTSAVNATAQSESAVKIEQVLTDEELKMFRRGKNTKINSVPKNSSVAEYHNATGLEVLFGWLYLTGENERLEQLFSIIFEV